MDEYVKISGEKLNKVMSPHLPRIPSEELDELLSKPGKLAPHAASMVMRLMYGARMAMPSLCVIIGRLSSQISRWTADSDRKLHRVFSYLDGALDKFLTGTLSTADVDVVKLISWPDADHNGDYMDTKSTSGFFLEIAGNDGRGMPLSWGCKKQGSTAQHTDEAEVVSMATSTRNELLPMQMLMQIILQRPVVAEIREDNAAAITAVMKGFSPALRHIYRTQRISLGFLHELVVPDPERSGDESEGRIELIKEPTATHKGDMFTKELEPKDFERALDLIRMRAE